MRASRLRHALPPLGPRYLGLRRQTEDLLRERFIEVGGRPERVAPPHPAHAGRVYRIEELRDSLARHDPRSAASPAYDGHQRADLDVYVEVQLWSDEPVRRWLSP